MISEQDTTDYASTLATEGIVIIDDYLAEETCDDLYSQIKESAENGDFDVSSGDENYDELANWGGGVVDKRTGRDEGMWDIFNVDSEIDDVERILNDESIQATINAASSLSFIPTNINVYWNRSVTNTRSFHADTYADKFKSFVYLTDVPDRSYGPFSYIKGSHTSSRPKRVVSKVANKIKGNPVTDAVFYDESNAVYCTAPKGTLIIANQSGYHRGYPQQKGRERMLVSTSYKPTE